MTKNKKLIMGWLAVAGVIVIVLIYESTPKTNEQRVQPIQTATTTASVAMNSELSEIEMERQVDEILSLLMQIHYVSLVDTNSADPNTIILDELTEAMNDLNKLKPLLFTSEELTKSRNEIISTTGLVVNVSVKQLINANSNWIQYLRGVDISTLNVAEFQYQLATYQSSIHDTYLTLVKSASYLPMVTVKFAETEGQKNTTNEDLKKHMLMEIDNKFSDILIADDKYHEKTNNRLAIPVLVRGYKDFFSK